MGTSSEKGNIKNPNTNINEIIHPTFLTSLNSIRLPDKYNDWSYDNNKEQ